MRQPQAGHSLRGALLSLRGGAAGPPQPRLDEAGLLELLETLAALMERFPQLAELEINPCRATNDRVSVLDARAVLRYE